MCDGTPCPCNLLDDDDPDSRYYARSRDRHLRAATRPPTSTIVRRHAVRVALWSALATVVWALLLTVTGWGGLNFLGPVSIVVCLVALLVAALAALSGLGAKVAQRHRVAVQEFRR